jgi:hypothetical protein
LVRSGYIAARYPLATLFDRIGSAKTLRKTRVLYAGASRDGVAEADANLEALVSEGRVNAKDVWLAFHECSCSGCAGRLLGWEV